MQRRNQDKKGRLGQCRKGDHVGVHYTGWALNKKERREEEDYKWRSNVIKKSGKGE